MSRTAKVVFWLAFASCVYLTAEAFLPPDRQPTARLSIAAIHAYQATGSQSMAAWGVHCRYTPTCSHYAIDAIRAYGTLDGLVRTAGRLWRCSPWGGSGYDPAVEPHAAAYLEPQNPQNSQETPEQRRARELREQHAREQMEKFQKDMQDLQKNLPEAGKNAGKAAAGCVGGCLMGILLKVILPGHFVLAVVLLILVLNDAKARGDSNLPVWVILVFFLSWIGALIYFVQRKKGDLTPCPSCRQNRLSTLAKCPHCGAEAAPPKPPEAAPGPDPSKT